MNNYSSQERKRALSGLNTFLTKMYGFMTLAVLVSALTACLTMTVFAQQVLTYFTNHQAMVWVLLLVPIALSMGISFKATRNPVASFIMLMAISIIYGLEFALIAGVYTQTQIASAFVSSAGVFAAMAIYGSVTKRSLDNAGAYASAALIGLLVAWLINMFLRSAAVAYVFSFIAVIIFTVLTAWDAKKMRQIYEQFGDQVSVDGLAVLGAMQLYLDFVNLFLQFLQIFGMSDSRN
ncbi:MAG: Bax inhibitor-1/YccA family protein [Lactobacillus sp.]|jgi:FtsH-binding integral membrane protein|nr:Bax inhibitor-1/YccA family protein [Lactobacillus sp.]MCH4068276.1 Bax inhibitor-1/YccA family protein [Lactobacillus sp.]MCI1304516.1 Bax inhibitor-1/YccA family protein [Lactobacillus sp.]MCI1330582.1 Bax inhibitor-1/YccA family protein [Lactobacillus sp.]MCI1359562.1 Bax inhibitor-1/YccA family protein [Lactobacillus sp.]